MTDAPTPALEDTATFQPPPPLLPMDDDDLLLSKCEPISPELLFIASLMIATKMACDAAPGAKTWAKAVTVSKSHVASPSTTTTITTTTIPSPATVTKDETATSSFHLDLVTIERHMLSTLNHRVGTDDAELERFGEAVRSMAVAFEEESGRTAAAASCSSANFDTASPTLTSADDLSTASKSVVDKDMPICTICINTTASTLSPYPTTTIPHVTHPRRKCRHVRTSTRSPSRSPSLPSPTASPFPSEWPILWSTFRPDASTAGGLPTPVTPVTMSPLQHVQAAGRQQLQRDAHGDGQQVRGLGVVLPDGMSPMLNAGAGGGGGGGDGQNGEMLRRRDGVVMGQ
ncbi:hypothetical protein HDU97_003674 [Phlyctochytrium planicorne]|nr:hypothetical protein HDU97_003674 [Phlyctochytrium planicorne]